jgi:hypothetical protein
MSEDKSEYENDVVNSEGELKFVRLKNNYDDLVGYVVYHQDYLTISKPLRIEIDTIFDEGRQILSLQEYLPQSLLEIKQVDISLEDVMFCTPVKKDFYDQYEYCRDFFYDNESKLRDPKIVKPRETDSNIEELNDTAQKVVSILEALQSKKDKPVH